MAKDRAKSIFVVGFIMKNVGLWTKVLAMASFFLNGCGQAPNPFKGYKQPPDTDVTSSPEYNFASFAGTVWKAKVKVGLQDLKGYTGSLDKAHHAHENFHPQDPSS